MKEEKFGLSLLMPDLKELLEEKKFDDLKKVLREVQAIDLVDDWGEFTREQKLVIFHLLTRQKAIDVFEEMEYEQQKELIDNLKSRDLKEILDRMASDERADLFKELPERVKKKLFSVMKKEDVEDVKELINYPENTAGSLMTTDFVELKERMTARQALLKVQQFYRRAEAVYTLYVTDTRHRLIGGLSLQELVTSVPDRRLKDIIKPMKVISINVDQDQEEVAKMVSKYDLFDAPVVDNRNELLGVITVDDIVDVIEQENTEDIYGMGKIANPAKTGQINYGEIKVLRLVKVRIVWLFILLMIGTFISGRLLKGYTSILESVIVLACFIPMLMDSGGNAGAQSLAMTVRALALGEITVDEMNKVIRKEIVAGFLTGLIMALVSVIAVFILQGVNVKLAITVGVSLLAIINISTVTGAFLPLVFTKIGLDPAVAASPFITTVVDATGLIVYFEVAKWLLL